MTQIIFKSIRVINPATSFDEVSDVIINKNKIVSILKNINLDTLVKKSKTIIYDCNGLSMAPGIIDMRINLGKTEHDKQSGHLKIPLNKIQEKINEV